ncbi:alpha-D-GlcNAc alpha-1,2-L-rhamnosyltransferase [Vibrio variabilis]|uniref:Alpha-D-GlcNAc alpha-1,2-L-rhamnosyltransferase n=1 Tax=Vibrio variabilis TaxID=990271 RepID=A0ABQ0J645_9VIBR|nr:alpha-D-GlcNAc alpha-1,2-L-rhamnosyltransferase [Vibrio variabilis]
MRNKHVIVLGIRGVPANHGGFETFAEFLCKYLITSGWQVTVYCQEDGSGKIYESEWQGVKRIHIPVSQSGPLGTIVFDLKSVIHSLKQDGVYLTLGYNTACFNVLHRLFGKTNVINMDGIEWKRKKWGRVAKSWFWLNERFGCWFGNYLVADHPCIEDHLATRVSRDKITMIPYGAPDVSSADIAHLEKFQIEPKKYSIIIARPEPENSILEVVKAFSSSKRNQKLVVLGNFTPDENPYHKLVLDSASDEVLFPGAIYDHDVVGALRFYSRYYVHGHQVGGTNPSLVEALGAGCAVLAHDNQFNQWVASDAAVYFSDQQALERFFDTTYNNDELVEEKKLNANKQFRQRFIWNDILSQYESLLIKAGKIDQRMSSSDLPST